MMLLYKLLILFHRVGDHAHHEDEIPVYRSPANSMSDNVTRHSNGAAVLPKTTSPTFTSLPLQGVLGMHVRTQISLF